MSSDGSVSGSDGNTSVLGVADMVVVAVVLLISSGIGLYFRFTGGKQATIKEYMMADRSMSMVPVAFSLMASFMSAITLLGVVQEMYMSGTEFIVINIAYIIATPIVCYFYLPIFFHLQKTSVYEYLEMRFGYPVRLLASVSFTLQMTLYMGIVVYAPALALAAVTGLSQTLSILVVGCVCTFYSALGGIKAVLITDLLQSLLMFAAICIVMVTGLQHFTPYEVLKIAGDSGRLEFFIMDPDPRTRHTFWTQVIGGVFTYLSLYGVNQAQVQRLLTIRTLRKSQAAVWLQWPILMVLSLSTAFAGLIMYAHYKDCDPVLSGVIQKADQLLPLYVVQYAGSAPGVTGLFIAGVFSGSLSTVSSSLNSLAAVTVSDYIEPLRQYLRPGQNAPLPAFISPLISTVFGVICVGIAFLTALLGSGVLQASFIVFGAVGGPLLGLFTLGMTTRIGNQKGAMTGLIFGLVLCLWIGFGQPKPARVYKPRSTDGCEAAALNTSLAGGAAVTARLVSPSLIPESSSLLLANPNTSYSFSAPGLASSPDDVLSKTLSPAAYENRLSGEKTTITGGRTRRGATEEGEETTEEGEQTNATGEDEETRSFLHEMYAISYAWVAMLGFLATYLVGLAVSAVVTLVGGHKPSSVSRVLLASCCGGGWEPETTVREEEDLWLQSTEGRTQANAGKKDLLVTKSDNEEYEVTASSRL